MLDRLLKFELQLIRIESLLLVVFVLLMLGLATYNVFYRNVLVPIQVGMLTNAVTQSAPPPVSDAEPAVAPEEASADEASGFAGGFGGGFDDVADDPAAGFGGGFGEVADNDPAAGFGGGFGEEPEEQPSDDSAGFAGDFGDDSGAGFAGDFAGDFGEATEHEPEGTRAPAAEIGAASYEEANVEMPVLAKLIDAAKIEWIDVLLRQLVLFVGFLGAMLATHRRKHITIDALSKVLPPNVVGWVNVFTALVSLMICVVLAVAGADLVAISIEYPKELMSWANEWHFQLVFPLGFGLLALHFAIRAVESAAYASGKVEPPEGYELTGGAA